MLKLSKYLAAQLMPFDFLYSQKVTILLGRDCERDWPARSRKGSAYWNGCRIPRVSGQNRYLSSLIRWPNRACPSNQRRGGGRRLLAETGLTATPVVPKQ